MNLAKLSWPEREDTGEANVVGVEALKWVIRIMALYKTSEAVSYPSEVLERATICLIRLSSSTSLVDSS